MPHGWIISIESEVPDALDEDDDVDVNDAETVIVEDVAEAVTVLIVAEDVVAAEEIPLLHATAPTAKINAASAKYCLYNVAIKID